MEGEQKRNALSVLYGEVDDATHRIARHRELAAITELEQDRLAAQIVAEEELLKDLRRTIVRLTT